MLENKQSLIANLKTLLPGIVYSSSSEGLFKVIEIDGNVELITGYSADDFRSGRLTLQDIIHPKDSEKISTIKNELFSLQQPFHFEYRIINSNQETIWVNESGYVGENNNIFGFISCQFVEGNRHQKLVDAQRLVLEVASSSEVASGDIAKVAEMICQACTEWLEVERASVWLFDEGQNQIDLVTLYLRSQHTFTDGITLSRSQYPNYFSALTSGRAIDAENASVDPRTSEFANGYLDVLDIRSMLDAAVRNGDSIIGVICCEQTVVEKTWSMDDINFVAELADQFSQTISNSEQIAVREQALKASAASEAKSVYLATMSHEIRTPLNGMLGMVELLNDTRLDTQQKDILETIQMSGNSLLSVINNVLDFSKIEAGKLEIVLKPVNLGKLIEQSWSTFEQIAAEENLVMRVLGNEEIPQLMLDASRFNQVLSNLISNAIKFSSNGEILIHIKLKSESLFLSVQDFGKGMSQELQSRLFSPFEQEYRVNDTQEIQGTGLGLAISKGIVESMNGELSARSDIGEGSIFTIKLPLAFAISPSDNAVTKNEELNKGKAFPESFRDLNVWVAEDNIVNQQVIKGLLKRHEVEAKVYANGQVLINALIEGDVIPDLILMDCEMPVLDGISAAKLIKVTPSWQNIRIAALTAHALTNFEETTKRAGMEYFLSKPIQKEELRAVLSKSMASKVKQQ